MKNVSYKINFWIFIIFENTFPNYNSERVLIVIQNVLTRYCLYIANHFKSFPSFQILVGDSNFSPNPGAMPLSPGNNIPIAYSPAASVSSCGLTDAGSPAPMPTHQPQMPEQPQGAQLTTLQPASSQNSSKFNRTCISVFDPITD